MPLPGRITRKLMKVQDLRYGENPHQKAALYLQQGVTLAFCEQIHGKGLSSTNVMDLDLNMHAGLQLEGFGKHVCTMVKHGSLSGAAVDSDPLRAYLQAYSSDAKSSFGCVMGLNTPVTPQIAELISKKEPNGAAFHFVEAIVAPAYDPKALELLKQNPDRRLIQFNNRDRFYDECKFEIRTSAGFYLVQDVDKYVIKPEDCSVVAGAVGKEELECARFSYVAGKFVKSNSALIASQTKTGFTTNAIGAGQQSRVDSFQVARSKYQENLKNRKIFSERFSQYGFEQMPSYLVESTDSFMPFPDSLDVAEQTGVRTVICPQGGKREVQVKERATELGLNLIWLPLDYRSFKH